MQLSNGTNTIDDRRYKIVADAMWHRHSEEMDFRSNLIAQGRSEYSMDDLFRLQRTERAFLEQQRRVLSITEWLKLYPEAR